MVNYYKTLGLQNFASQDEIKKAFRKLSKKFHPDLNDGDEYFTNMFREIKVAYDFLSDPLKKDKLDQFLKFGSNSSYDNNNQYEENLKKQREYQEKKEKEFWENQKKSQRQTDANENDKTANQSLQKDKKGGENVVFFLCTGVLLIILLILFKDNFSIGNSGVDDYEPVEAAEETIKASENITYTSDDDVYRNGENKVLFQDSYDDTAYDNFSHVESSYDDSLNEELTSNSYSGSFTMGSSKEEVKRVQGTPSRISSYGNREVWGYGISTVTFTNGKVSEYSDFENILKIVVLRNISTSYNTTFTIGSTKEEVKKAQGTPTRINNYGNSEIWAYGISTVTFTNGKVSEYSDFENILKIVVHSNVPTSSHSTFTLGSTKVEVKRAQGTPSRISNYGNSEIWAFGINTVTFKNGRVSDYSDYEGVLRAK